MFEFIVENRFLRSLDGRWNNQPKRPESMNEEALTDGSTQVTAACQTRVSNLNSNSDQHGGLQTHIIPTTLFDGNLPLTHRRCLPPSPTRINSRSALRRTSLLGESGASNTTTLTRSPSCVPASPSTNRGFRTSVAHRSTQTSSRGNGLREQAPGLRLRACPHCGSSGRSGSTLGKTTVLNGSEIIHCFPSFNLVSKRLFNHSLSRFRNHQPFLWTKWFHFTIVSFINVLIKPSRGRGFSRPPTRFQGFRKLTGL